MGLYNFQQRFAPFILRGSKRHTIRAHRKHPDTAGNTLHLYTGLRTKTAQLLMRVPCVKVEEIEIVSGCSADARCCCSARVIVNGVELTYDECEALAKKDGFPGFAAMKTFWKGRVPFAGQIIHWKYSRTGVRKTI